MSTRQVHVIGVDHMIQHNGFVVAPSEDVDPKLMATAIREFQGYLRQQIKLMGATVLAEEFSNDAMTKSGATILTAAQVALELRIRHLSCDPGKVHRRRLGIRNNDPHGNRLREHVWATRLARLRARAVLFLCGDEHVDTFPTVLMHYGFKSRVLSQGWGAQASSNTPERTSDVHGRVVTGTRQANQNSQAWPPSSAEKMTDGR